MQLLVQHSTQIREAKMVDRLVSLVG